MTYPYRYVYMSVLSLISVKVWPPSVRYLFYFIFLSNMHLSWVTFTLSKWMNEILLESLIFGNIWEKRCSLGKKCFLECFSFSCGGSRLAWFTPLFTTFSNLSWEPKKYKLHKESFFDVWLISEIILLFYDKRNDVDGFSAALICSVPEDSRQMEDPHRDHRGEDCRRSGAEWRGGENLLRF